MQRVLCCTGKVLVQQHRLSLVPRHAESPGTLTRVETGIEAPSRLINHVLPQSFSLEKKSLIKEKKDLYCT